jgi:hypothetical protein
MKLINTKGWETVWQRPPLTITDSVAIEVEDVLGRKILAQEPTVIEIKDKKEIKHGK